MLKRLLKRIRLKSGAAVLEAALCLPVLLYLIFFIIEAMRIGIYQIAVDNMAVKLAFEYAALKNTANFSTIINNSKPKFFKNMNDIHCRVYVFSDVATMYNSGKMSENPLWSSSQVSIQYPSGVVTPSAGCAIMVTVSHKFPFSSAFVQKLFGGGKNYGNNYYLLWGRSACVCN